MDDFGCGPPRTGFLRTGGIQLLVTSGVVKSLTMGSARVNGVGGRVTAAGVVGQRLEWAPEVFVKELHAQLPVNKLEHGDVMVVTLARGCELDAINARCT